MKHTKKLFDKLEIKEILFYKSSIDYLENHIRFETLIEKKGYDNSLLEDKE